MQDRAQRLPLALSGLGVLAVMNFVIATRVAEGGSSYAVLVALLPAGLVATGALIASSRSVLVFAALGLGVIGGPTDGIVNGALPLPGTIKVYPTDIIVCLALGAWVAAWLSKPPEARPTWPRTPVLGWPLLLLAIAIIQAVLRGNEQYGTAILSGPIRLVFYAGIAAAIAGLQPKTAYRGICAVFYAGTIWHVLGAIQRLLAGTSMSDELSTGGFRIVALSTGMYLGAALVLALLNVELEDRAGRRALHLVMAALATFGILATFGRTHYLVMGPLVVLLLLRFGRMRSAVAAFVPLAVPLLVVIAILLPRATPEFGQTLQDRIALNAEEDSSISWRKVTTTAVWEEQIKRSPLVGVGFGQEVDVVFDQSRLRIGQDPHNGYVYLLAGGGILALGSFVILIVVFFHDAWNRFRTSDGVERALVTWAMAVCVIFLANFATTPFFNVPRIDLTLWIALLLPATVSTESTRGPVKS